MKQPHLLIDEGDVHETVFVPGSPNRVERIGRVMDTYEEVSGNREYNIINGEYKDARISVCSTGIGSPSTAIAIEELANVGAKNLIRVGTAGGLQRDVEIGDMVVATGAAKFEGTTKRYESVEYPAVPSLDVTNALVNSARRHGEDVHVGPIVTDDAFYAEDEPAKDWHEAGMVAVEMEASALFSLCRRNGLKSGAIVTVDGNLILGTQKGETDEGELPEKARNNVERAIQIALDAVVEGDF
ncbi:MAG: nucleoside phosphorylase [Halobacteria archaeon]|nr:nucleoside phosphorylase [Halobacteria archaeon]